MSFPERHELPDGTPIYTGAGCPFDDNGVDLTLVDAMLAMTPTERLGWLEDTLALAETLRSARRGQVLIIYYRIASFAA